MSLSQSFTDQPVALSSNSGGSKPQLIIKVLQTLQSASLVPFSNALPSAPPVAKKMQHVAFECSMHLSYPSISITDCIPYSLPTGLQPIYEDTYLANSSPKVLDRVAADEWKSIFRHYPSYVNVEMGAPEELDAMTLDYPEDVLPPPVPVSSLKTWFFKPLIKQDPSDNSSSTRDKMIRTAIKCIVLRISSLVSGSRKMMLEQDLWALADGLLQGAFDSLKEQLQHLPSKPPASFSSESLLRFIKLLTVEYQTLTQPAEHSKAENLCLQEQVASRDAQLNEKDEELTCLNSFVRHFKGDVPSLETQQLRETLEGQESKIKKELQLQDVELAQLQQLFKSVQGQFAAASPSKPSSSSS
ncbi:hypothetical protein GYMLUDRAFT_248262 [Collybiopsis luxurians FD-317 M1]|uniref:Uncharacterized protein n=1 Tax=Collybiopsis luxurians FD-317 M1 TaxID=944289 RepID=A0A0D0CL23_9AGAR|nr:hypothetical protein GYMLUDRAFT_248262 [Collybiopsis luxurians FD-317 M1]